MTTRRSFEARRISFILKQSIMLAGAVVFATFVAQAARAAAPQQAAAPAPPPAAAATTGAATGAATTGGPAQPVGTSTGLPLPRYVSLKSDRVNLREGPSRDHRTAWIFERAGLPVEVTAEFDVWRRIRDAEGDEGWVVQSMLSGRRTALVKPWGKGAILPIFAKPDAQTAVDANLQSGVIGSVKKCNDGWCRIFGSGFDGWIQETNLWGVYPNEPVD